MLTFAYYMHNWTCW